MRTDYVYRCRYHGEVVTVHAERLFSSPPSVKIILDCGCFTHPLLGGTEDMTVCEAHGPVQVVLVAQECPKCGAHRVVLLNCGCTGAVMQFDGVNVFRKEDA